jgi:hypothetical protein
MEKSTYIILVSISFFVASISCSSVNNDKENQEAELVYDSISIPINELCYSSYTNFSFNEELNIYAGYNSKTHAIDIYDIESGTFTKHLNIKSEGPDAILGALNGLSLHNKDSIFAYTMAGLFIIDFNGQLIDYYRIFDYIGQGSGLPTINENFRLNYFSNTGDIFFQMLHPTNNLEANLESSVVSKFNIRQKEFVKLPITFSSKYIDNKGRVGFLRWMNFESAKGDSIFFNAQFDDELLIFNLRTGDLSRKALNGNDICKPLNNFNDQKAWVDHSVENDHRFSILYDKWRDVYYRFVWEGVPVKISDKHYNSMLDKTLSLEVYDKNFKFLKKFNLPENQYNINCWFVAPKGLYISPSHPQSKKMVENILKFDIIKLNYKNEGSY